MDNKTTEKAVPSINLGGRIWFLKVTHRVLERFSSIARCNMSDLDAALMRYDMMVLLLWLMMCESRRDLTRDKLSDWLNEMSPFDAIHLVSDAISEAMAYSFPEPEKKPENDSDRDNAENPMDADI